jgi:hypothetical protein
MVTAWQPLTTVAIGEGSDACVPVTVSFDLFDQVVACGTERERFLRLWERWLAR